jgi:hypothetical protein
MEYKWLGDAGELAAEAVPRLTRWMVLCVAARWGGEA